jgi:hypothetical protein
MNEGKNGRMAAEAIQRKKAWVMAIALIGKPASVSDHDLTIPNYGSGHWKTKQLKRRLNELEMDLKSVCTKYILLKWSPSTLQKAVRYLARKYDEWCKAKEGIWEVDRVHNFEQAVGQMGFRKFMECPLYAQVLVQGFQGAAIRHPEYHLARDLELLNNLFLDAEKLSEELFQKKIPHATEVNQSLARSTILTCFNLLEAFVSGLIAEYILANPNAPSELIQKLRKPDRTRNSLAARFEDIPCMVTGNPDAIVELKPVLATLFGECKELRNSYVHCVPSATATSRGVSKEGRFHAADAQAVRTAVRHTLEAIRGTWKVVYGCEGPRWLKTCDHSDRFPSLGVGLQGATLSRRPACAASQGLSSLR